MWELVPQALVNGLLLASLYSIIALGLTLIFGVLDVVNFSHGQLVTLGAYLAFELASREFHLWLAIPVIMVMLGGVGLLMESTTFRPVRAIPINGLLVSIGWIAILGNVFTVVWGPTPRNMNAGISGTLQLGLLTISLSQLIVLGASVLVMIAMTLVLRRTSAGRILRATAQNREAAMLMGIRVRRVDAAAFTVGAALAGLGGGLIANLFPIDPLLGESYMVYAFVALIVGGAGSAVGAVVGSVIVGLSISLTQTFASTAVASVAPFVVLILVLFIRPKGVFASHQETSL